MMITDIEDYFTKGCGRCDRFETPDCSTKFWIDGLHHLRAICLDLGLEEHVKWGHPCYMFAGRNICIIGAFRDNFRLSFMNASLLSDPETILQKRGQNTQNPDMISFADSNDVARLESIIRLYLREAMDYAEKKIFPQKEKRALEWPDELIDALDADPELAEAFHALTPGHQNSYLFHFNGTKNSETRKSRIEKSRPKIFKGLGQLEYQK